MSIATGSTPLECLWYTRVGGFTAGRAVAVTQLTGVYDAIAAKRSDRFTVGVRSVYTAGRTTTVTGLTNGDVHITAGRRAVIHTS